MDKIHYKKEASVKLKRKAALNIVFEKKTYCKILSTLGASHPLKNIPGILQIRWQCILYSGKLNYLNSIDELEDCVQ